MRKNLYVAQASWASKDGSTVNNLVDTIRANSEEEAIGLLLAQGIERWPIHQWRMNSAPIAFDISNLVEVFCLEERGLIRPPGNHLM